MILFVPFCRPRSWPKAIDMSWICEDVDKTKISQADHPEKIVVALNQSNESVIGNDATKSLFESQQVGTWQTAWNR